ncbi:MAG: hypothetical protein L0I76_30550 [Pseudonocardia sp.]|nr:hypothetical protein [Pseudonocardia sp.]
MSVTSSEQLAGLLVAVITGGRPLLKERPTHRYLDALTDLGVHDTVWVVADADADSYEPDGHDLAVYPRAWAEEWAADHWMLPTPPEQGGFLGAFPGREWACREAERRGCWGVLQLDDNIRRLTAVRGNGFSARLVERRGGLGLFADLLAAVTLSTNSRMTGAGLGANPNLKPSERKVANAGFPYSLFIERVGAGREPWYGPFEDDITHALQYGGRADGATAALMQVLTYEKESKSKSGMRSAYNHERSVQLQRIFPESAKVGVRKTTANGRGTARVFHTMLRGAIRNPLAVHDPDLFAAAKAQLVDIAAEWHTEFLTANREKAARRTRSAGRTT